VKIVIEDYISINAGGYHNASSYQVALDKDFTIIIDQTIKDKVNVKYWHTPLPKVNGEGYYSNLTKVYARVKVWIDDFESPWYVLPIVNQQDQVIVVTEEGKEDQTYNSLEIKMNMS
jgi:hypothetical protein